MKILFRKAYKPCLMKVQNKEALDTHKPVVLMMKNSVKLQKYKLTLICLQQDLLARYCEKKENQSRNASHGVNNSLNSLKDTTAEVSKDSDQGSGGDTRACGIQDNRYCEAIQEITDIASELPSRCSELLEAFEQKDKSRSSPPFEKSQRDTTVVVTVSSVQRDIPASDFQHNSQQIVDVAADLLSRCFELEALNLEREEDQRSSEGIEDRVDAAANLLDRYFEAGLFSCEASNHETQRSSGPHKVSFQHNLQQIVDVAADLISKCFELESLNLEREESQRHSATSDDPSGLSDKTAEGSEQRHIRQ